MSTLERAIQIAAQAHEGKTDKAGELYILHPLRVMLSLPTEELRIIGVVHDVIEDTDITAERLIAEGFSRAIIEALDSLTKRDGEKYTDFIRRAAVHPLARRVKIEDLVDNLHPERLAKLPADVAARLRAKYGEALDLLVSASSEE